MYIVQNLYILRLLVSSHTFSFFSRLRRFASVCSSWIGGIVMTCDTEHACWWSVQKKKNILVIAFKSFIFVMCASSFLPSKFYPSPGPLYTKVVYRRIEETGDETGSTKTSIKHCSFTTYEQYGVTGLP
jgi:hypothetical protein